MAAGQTSEASGRPGERCEPSRTGRAEDPTRALRLAVAGSFLLVLCVLAVALSANGRGEVPTILEAHASVLTAQQVRALATEFAAGAGMALVTPETLVAPVSLRCLHCHAPSWALTWRLPAGANVG